MANKLEIELKDDTAENMKNDIPQDTTTKTDDIEVQDDVIEAPVDLEEVEPDLFLASLKLKKRHPKNSFRVGSISVDSYSFKDYELTKSEVDELYSEGAQDWVEIGE